jgi:hypothetical protein
MAFKIGNNSEAPGASAVSIADTAMTPTKWPRPGIVDVEARMPLGI